MNKMGLIHQMSVVSNLTKSDCKKALEAFMEIIIENLKNHEETNLTNFGTFLTFKREARVGVNPHTHKKMSIPKVYVAKFRPAKSLKKLPKPQ